MIGRGRGKPLSLFSYIGTRMSRTLLYTVQRVLEKLDLDVVNSINDSQDAVLIAREAEDTFFDLINRNEWPERYDLIDLESVGSTSNPTALRLPSNVLRITSLRYDITEDGDENQSFRTIEQLDPEEFLDIVYARKSSLSNVQEVSYKGIPLYVYNDQQPTYFTTFDNNLLVLDSFVNTTETTLNGTKAVCRGSFLPSWQHTDNFVIPLDNNTYPLYLAELSSACSISLNGAVLPTEEFRKAAGMNNLRRKAFRTEKHVKKNDYGRIGNGVS